MKNVNVWSRLFLPEAGADQIWSEPESAPGPRTSGAAKKSGGSATLHTGHPWKFMLKNIAWQFFFYFNVIIQR